MQKRIIIKNCMESNYVVYPPESVHHCYFSNGLEKDLILFSVLLREIPENTSNHWLWEEMNDLEM